MAFLTETKISRQPSKSISRRLMIAVRIRPLKEDETDRILHKVDDQVVVLAENEADRNDILRQSRGGDRQYVFDAVFGEDSSQETIFEKTTQTLVKEVLDGYNATVFAYGASGSGKTHTMLGTNAEPGIMVRALNEIFGFVKSNSLPRLHFNVTMSYLEIYNENIRDLLNPDSGYLEVREDQKEKTIHVVNLSEVSTNSTEEAPTQFQRLLIEGHVTGENTKKMMRLLQKGNRARSMEPTALNKTSSRSHALLSITVRQTHQINSNTELKARVKQGKLFMIDLAGSERASQTKNRGKRLVEGAHINRSLLALGNCINALSGGASYVNYRDSKLTRLLKDSLGGNSQTCMIAHVSPALIHREESKNTLLYADRAKSISSKVTKNILDISYHVSQYRTIISELRDEITRLKSKMMEEKKNNYQKISTENKEKISELPRRAEGISRETSRSESMNDILESEDHLTTLKCEILATFREQMKLRKRLLGIETYLMELRSEADRQYSIISEWRGKCSRLYKNARYPERMPDKPDLGSLDLDYQEIESEYRRKSLERALIDLTVIENEQDKYSELKALTEVELEKCKEKGALLEKELPREITSEDERELLSLIIKVHELEIDKIVLQTERLTKEHALRQKDILISKYGRQRQICEEIIARQKQIMEEEKLTLPPDLQEMYQLYQQELFYASYSDHNMNEVNNSRNSAKFPPIFNRRFDHGRGQGVNSENGLDDSDSSMRSPSSSTGSDWQSSLLPRRGRPSYSLSNTASTPTDFSFPPISKSF